MALRLDGALVVVEAPVEEAPQEIPEDAAPDLDAAVKSAIGSIYFNQGESCNAPSRVLVHEKVADRFLEIVTAEAPKYSPGDPLSGSAEMGALVDETALTALVQFARNITVGAPQIEAVEAPRRYFRLDTEGGGHQTRPWTPPGA